MTPSTFVALFGLVLVLLVLFLFWRQDRIERRQFKEFMNRTPSATRRYPLVVDAKLDLDITEDFYHKN